MATETALTTQATTAGSAITTFVAAHPITVAIIGGVVVGASAYWLMGKYFKKEEAPAAA